MERTVELKPVESIPQSYGKWGDVIMDFLKSSAKYSEVSAPDLDATRLNNSLVVALKRMKPEIRERVQIIRRKNRVYLTRR